MGRKFAIIALAALGMSSTAFAQSTDTETTQSHTKIIQGINLSVLTTLEFGTIAKPATAGGTGTVTISSAGTATPSGAVGLVSGGATRSAATYKVNGEPNQAFSITVNNGNASFNLSNGTDTIAVTPQLQASPPTAIAANGEANFAIGGVMTVGGGVSTGDYNGSFPVTVAYN